MNFIKKNSILNISPYKAGIAQNNKISSSIYKLSSNENPLGCSDKIYNQAEKIFQNLHLYPNSNSDLLRKALGAHYNIDSERVICGCGSDEIISMIINAFTTINSYVSYSEYGFLMYRIYALGNGCTVQPIPEVNLKPNITNIIQTASEFGAQIIFLANPNNPTGTIISIDDIKHILNNINPSQILVLDCAYHEYISLYTDDELFDLVDQYNNLIITRTFSKIYGLSSLRVGWGYASSEIINILQRVRSPFNVNQIAQDSAIIALSDQDFIQKSIEHNNEWKQKFDDALKLYPLSVNTNIDGNFILLHFHDRVAAEKMYIHLFDNGIITRELEPYKLPNSLRITIGNQVANKLLIKLIQEFYS